MAGMGWIRAGACLAAGVVGLAACGGSDAAPSAARRPAVAASAATACSPPPIAVTIEERQRVFVHLMGILHTPYWRLYGGIRWPEQQLTVAFVSTNHQRIEHLLPGDQVVASPGNRLVVLGQKAFIVRGADPPQPLATGLRSAAFSPDESRIIGLYGQQLMLIDASTGSILKRSIVDQEADLDVKQWRGDQIVLGQDNDVYAVVRATDLHLSVPTFRGTMSPSGRLAAAIDGEQYDSTKVKLLVVDATTGTRLHERTIDPPGYTRVGRALCFTPDDRLLVWQDNDGLMMLEVATGRLRQAPYLSLGEGDAESMYLAAPTADGRQVCFAMDRHDRTYDLRSRRALQDRPGWAVRCLIGEHRVAHVLQLPLGPHEIVLDIPSVGFGNQPDFVLSADERLGAVLVTDGRIDPMAQRPLALVLVELGKRKIRHRIDLGHIDAGGGEPRIWRSEDGRAVEMGYSNFDDRAWRVDFQSGAKTKLATRPPQGPPSTARAETLPGFEVDPRARAIVRGATVLWQGRKVMHAWRLDEQGKRILARRSKCTPQLSPKGERVLRQCADRSKGELFGFDGRPPKTVPDMGMADCFGVADDGAVAWATESTLHVMADGVRHAIDLVQSSGQCIGLAWSPDGRSLAAWQEGAHLIFLVDRGADQPRWSRVVDHVSLAPRLRFTDDGRYVLAGEGDWERMVGVLDAQDGSDSPFDRADATTAIKSNNGILLKLEGLVPYGASKLSPIVLQQPLGDSWPEDGSIAAAGQLVITTHQGVVRLHRADTGAPIATALPLTEGGAVVLFEDGRIDWLGKPAAPADLLCLQGTRVAPAAVCSTLTDRGALARTLQKGTEAELPPCPTPARNQPGGREAPR